MDKSIKYQVKVREKKEREYLSTLSGKERKRDHLRKEEIDPLVALGFLDEVGNVPNVIGISFSLNGTHPYNTFFRYLMADKSGNVYNNISLSRFPKTTFIVGKQSIPGNPDLMGIRDSNGQLRDFVVFFRTNFIEYLKNDRNIFLSIGLEGVNINRITDDFNFRDYLGRTYYNDGEKITRWDGKGYPIIDDIKHYIEWSSFLSVIYVGRIVRTLEDMIKLKLENIRIPPVVSSVLELPPDVPEEIRTPTPASSEHIDQFIIEDLDTSKGTIGGKELYDYYLSFCKRNYYLTFCNRTFSQEIVSRGFIKTEGRARRIFYNLSLNLGK